MKIKYIAVIKEWRDKLYGNTYFAASIDDLVKDKVYKIPFQYGCGSHSESICKAVSYTHLTLPTKRIV